MVPLVVSPVDNPLESRTIEAHLERLGLQVDPRTGIIQGSNGRLIENLRRVARGGTVTLHSLIELHRSREGSLLHKLKNHSLFGSEPRRAKAELEEALSSIRAAAEATWAMTTDDELFTFDIVEFEARLAALEAGVDALRRATQKSVLAHASPKRVRLLSEAYLDLAEATEAFERKLPLLIKTRYQEAVDAVLGRGPNRRPAEGRGKKALVKSVESKINKVPLLSKRIQAVQNLFVRANSKPGRYS